MNLLFKFINLVSIITLAFISNAQTKSVDFYPSIKDYDLSKLWHSDSLHIEGDGDKISFPEPLGYIGDSFQRFYIHYISVTKNKSNSYQYDVFGKTKVNDNICSFHGTIT